MTSIRNRRSATARAKAKTTSELKRICFRVTTARVFREPRSLGSRGVLPRKKINPPLIAENASRKSRRAPTRAPPIILIGGTPVHGRRARYTDTPSRSAAAAAAAAAAQTSFVARPNRIRARSKSDPIIRPKPLNRDDHTPSPPHAKSICASWSLGRYSRSTPLRLGWRSFRNAFASIWRMRSRVTLNTLPISSSVFTRPSSKP